MTNLEETALRLAFADNYDTMPHEKNKTHVSGKVIADYWLSKMKAHESAEKERISSRLAYMFANAPETYHAIKQIIYSQ